VGLELTEGFWNQVRVTVSSNTNYWRRRQYRMGQKISYITLHCTSGITFLAHPVWSQT